LLYPGRKAEKVPNPRTQKNKPKPLKWQEESRGENGGFFFGVYNDELENCFLLPEKSAGSCSREPCPPPKTKNLFTFRFLCISRFLGFFTCRVQKIPGGKGNSYQSEAGSGKDA